MWFDRALGEGGTFALYQGLYPPEMNYPDDDSLLDSKHEKDSETSSRAHMNTHVQHSTMSPRYQWPLFIWVRAVRCTT